MAATLRLASTASCPAPTAASLSVAPSLAPPLRARVKGVDRRGRESAPPSLPEFVGYEEENLYLSPFSRRLPSLFPRAVKKNSIYLRQRRRRRFSERAFSALCISRYIFRYTLKISIANNVRWIVGEYLSYCILATVVGLFLIILTVAGRVNLKLRSPRSGINAMLINRINPARFKSKPISQVMYLSLLYIKFDFQFNYATVSFQLKIAFQKTDRNDAQFAKNLAIQPDRSQADFCLLDCNKKRS